MNFNEWQDKYYPGVSDDTKVKMSHAWEAAKIGPALKLSMAKELIYKWRGLSWSPSPFSCCYNSTSAARSDTYDNCAKELEEVISDEPITDRIAAMEAENASLRKAIESALDAATLGQATNILCKAVGRIK